MLMCFNLHVQDLESGHDVVVAESVFLHEVELFPYACAAKLASYVTYVVSFMPIVEHYFEFIPVLSTSQ